MAVMRISSIYKLLSRLLTKYLIEMASMARHPMRIASILSARGGAIALSTSIVDLLFVQSCSRAHRRCRER